MRQHRIALLAFLLGGCAALPPAPVPRAESPAAPAVVFDIDGTLTPSVTAVFQVRADAAAAAHAFAVQGYRIVYLTSRVGWLSSGIPGWLADHGFPEGSVHVAQTREDRAHPEAFKARVLREFLANGWDLRYAYGDSSTDLAAYAAVGIPVERVFALRRRGAAACQPGPAAACLAGWTEHLGFIARATPVGYSPAQGTAPSRRLEGDR